MDWSESASEAFREFYNYTEIQQGQAGKYASIKPFASRACELAQRVATVVAFFCGRHIVDHEDAKAGVALAEYSLSEWLRYAEASTVDFASREAIECSSWLVEKAKAAQVGKVNWQSFTAKEWIQAGPGKYRSAKTRDRVFDVLVAHNHLLIRGERYLVNPKLLFEVSHPANFANSANSHEEQGFPVANSLLMVANSPEPESKPTEQLASVSKPLANTSLDKPGVSAELAELATPPVTHDDYEGF